LRSQLGSSSYGGIKIILPTKPTTKLHNPSRKINQRKPTNIFVKVGMFLQTIRKLKSNTCERRRLVSDKRNSSKEESL
jgi:hypothetical protein